MGEVLFKSTAALCNSFPAKIASEHFLREDDSRKEVGEFFLQSLVQLFEVCVATNYTGGNVLHTSAGSDCDSVNLKQKIKAEKIIYTVYDYEPR